jgi:hypothetical protein
LIGEASWSDAKGRNCPRSRAIFWPLPNWCLFVSIRGWNFNLFRPPTEFQLRNIPFRQQPPFDVTYIVVDTKVIDQITDHERGLMLNYLRITRTRVGIILNFKHRKLEWERLAL